MMNSIPPLLVSAAAYLEAQEKDIIFRWVQIASVFLLSERLNFLLDDIISVTLDTFTTLMTEQDNGGETK
jgi:hypothetical protein